MPQMIDVQILTDQLHVYYSDTYKDKYLKRFSLWLVSCLNRGARVLNDLGFLLSSVVHIKTKLQMQASRESDDLRWETS